AAGTAFVTADSSNQTLILRDKTGSASIGSNLVTSQAFNNATYWTCTGWTTTATNATHNVGNTTGCATTGSNLSFSSYEYYEVKFTISGNSNPSNTITPSLGDWNYISYGANQTYTLVMYPTSTGSLTFTPTSNFNGTISNVSVKLISGSTSVLSVSDSGASWNPIEVRVDGGVGFGYQTLVNNTTGGGNYAFGSSALNFNTSGNDNSAFGGNALAYNTIGTFNSAFGRYSLWYNSSGSYNVAMGGYSLSNNTIGNNNTAVGYQSLYYNTTGYNNTAAGYESLRSNTTGIHNTASGFRSLYYNQTGSMNTAFGLNAGRGNGLTFSNFNNNSLYGYAAGMSLQTGGDNNILIGYQAGDAITTGASNILIGYNIDAQSATGSNQLSIGNVIFGGGGFGTGTTVGTGRIGIGGVEDGTDKLRVYGDVKVGTSGTNGCIKRFDGAALTGTCSSDERFKEEVTSMSGILNKVANLQAVTYKFNQLGKDYTGATGNEIQYGLIAQQVLQVAPELVSTDENGYLKLRYDLLPIYAIAAIGEQQTQITDAQDRLTALENSIQPASNNILDLTNGGTIQGNLNVVGNLNVTGPVTMKSLTVTDNVVIAGNLTVQNVTVANLTVNGHIITAGNAPVATAGTAAGTEDTQNNIPAPQVTIEGNDTAGTITIVAGANTTTGDLAEVTFNQAFSKVPKVILTAGNEQTTDLKFFRSAQTGKFLINL
ncbi:MAG TPA: tail fiber domain-containing protein, partial [Candidatus Saccharibacteria bacterium]|nr:tail fiber domain-containing protein [Candidatus Saccharibacteria bacterium]